MREFSNNISESLLNGLTRDPRARRQLQFLIDAKNVRVRDFGLDEPDVPTDPFNGGVSVSYPYPQLFKGSQYMLLCYANQIDTVDTSTDPWGTTTLSLINLDGTSGTISGTGHWHFLDLDESWFLFNGTDIVFLDPEQTFTGETITAYVTTAITAKTGSFNRGRAFIGCLDESDIWSQGFDRIYDNIRDGIEDPVPLFNNGISGNTVLWSSIGAHDFPLWLMFPQKAISGNLEEFKLLSDALIRRTALYETLIRNEFGFMQMDFQGDVQAIMPLGEHMIVYGEDGVNALTPYVSQDSQISTMRKTHLADFGIANRSDVGGSKRSHIFISDSGDLYSLSADLSLNKLGYSNHLSGLSNVRISFDPDETEFHISSDSTNFILTSNGLTKERYQITSGVPLSGDFNCVFNTDADDEVLVVTSTYDFGLRAQKTINSIQFGSTYNGNMSVAVDYRFKDSASFARTDFVPINDESGAFIRIAGVDFRFVIKCDDLTGFELDYIQVKWQASDKRQIRGVYVSPTSTGTG